ncbi:photosystem reaction center subunit H, partial [Elstera litoralis]
MSNPLSIQTEAAPFAGQSMILSAISPTHLLSGYRTSKVVGATVVNEMDATIGTVDDLIVSPTDKSAFAILSVGGFLGIGAKYVVVPFSSL